MSGRKTFAVFVIAPIALLLALGAPARAEPTAGEEEILARVRAIAAAPLDDFTPLSRGEESRDGGYRYQLAFLAYGLCSVVEGTPGLRPEGARLFERLLEKMEHPTTLAYWRALGYEGDGVSRKNIMYRGHLNLMYALARDRFAIRRFDEKFHALSRALHDEMTGAPICCEPDQLFLQCNAVTVLSLWLHDRSFATTYAAAGAGMLAWAREHMAIEGTRLFRDDYRPSTGTSTLDMTGYANAWVIAFLGPVPGYSADAAAMYQDWRRTFALQGYVFGAAKGAPAGAAEGPLEKSAGSALLATTFGALAAREMNDRALWRKLCRSVAVLDAAAALIEDGVPEPRRAELRTFRTIALLARTFRGWREVLGDGPVTTVTRTAEF
jgi:hypothetical protein